MVYDTSNSPDNSTPWLHRRWHDQLISTLDIRLHFEACIGYCEAWGVQKRWKHGTWPVSWFHCCLHCWPQRGYMLLECYCLQMLTFASWGCCFSPWDESGLLSVLMF